MYVSFQIGFALGIELQFTVRAIVLRTWARTFWNPKEDYDWDELYLHFSLSYKKSLEAFQTADGCLANLICIFRW